MMSPVEFEPTIPTSERSQTHFLEGECTGIGSFVLVVVNSTSNWIARYDILPITSVCVTAHDMLTDFYCIGHHTHTQTHTHTLHSAQRSVLVLGLETQYTELIHDVSPFVHTKISVLLGQPQFESRMFPAIDLSFQINFSPVILPLETAESTESNELHDAIRKRI